MRRKTFTLPFGRGKSSEIHDFAVVGDWKEQFYTLFDNDEWKMKVLVLYPNLAFVKKMVHEINTTVQNVLKHN